MLKKIGLKFKLWKLSRVFKKYQKCKILLNSRQAEQKKFIKFFIQDEEDKILNKKILDEFVTDIQQYQCIMVKLKNKINVLLYKLGIIDINFIEVLYTYKFSDKYTQLIKEVLKDRISG